jgi:hypothetical protein
MVEGVPGHASRSVSGRPAPLGDALGARPQSGDYRVPVLAYGGRVACGRRLQPKAELAGVRDFGVKHVLDDLVAVAAPTARPFAK